MQSILLPVAVIAATLLTWHLFVGGEGVADFPTLERVMAGFGELMTVHEGESMPRLIAYSIASVFRVTWGFLLATGVAIPLGLVMGWYGRAFWALNPIVQIMRPISPIAWIPIAILMLHNDDPRSIFLIFISTFFPIVVST
ncbi:MAG TPA: ABC transporter permease, partial [Planctomycetota bacterium]|nr:ABC transporter permease [Planctomycetota bacterium]